MFATKPLLPSSNPSHFHLPPINKTVRRRTRTPAPPQTPKSRAIAENVSALKAKYTDYTTWLKSTTQPNHEPVLTQELLKSSLCQMGIDTIKAEQLVTKCTWYVYQFQKDLKIDEQSTNSPRQKQNPTKNKLKKTKKFYENIEDSTTTFSTIDPDDSSSVTSRHPYFQLPEIHISNSSSSSSSRYRRVDFDDELVKTSNHELNRPSLSKTRLKSISTVSSTSHSLPPINSNLSSFHRTLRRHGIINNNNNHHTRSILRKQPSTSSSTISTDINNEKRQSRLLTPISTRRTDQIPLGTRSQRLFGGSEYFAQIMNELEQQNK